MYSSVCKTSSCDYAGHAIMLRCRSSMKCAHFLSWRVNFWITEVPRFFFWPSRCVLFTQQLALFAPRALPVHAHVQTLRPTLTSRQVCLINELARMLLSSGTKFSPLFCMGTRVPVFHPYFESFTTTLSCYVQPGFSLRYVILMNSSVDNFLGISFAALITASSSFYFTPSFGTWSCTCLCFTFCSNNNLRRFFFVLLCSSCADNDDLVLFSGSGAY